MGARSRQDQRTIRSRKARLAYAFERAHLERPRLEPREHLGLLAQGRGAIDPEVAGIARSEVRARLLKQRGNAAQQAGEAVLVGGGQRIGKREEVDHRGGGRTLVLRDIAAVGEHGRVVGGIARPGPADPQVEVEAVHLGLYEAKVGRLERQEAARFDRSKPGEVPWQGLRLGLHRIRAVIGNAVPDGGLLEIAPLLGESHEVVVTAGGAGGK